MIVEIEKGLLKLEEFKKDKVLSVLKLVNWNISKAARTLGVSRKTLYRWIEKYDWERPEKEM